MTPDQKKVLKAVGTLVLIKAAIYGTIAFSARSLRKANQELDPEGSFQGYTISRKTGAVGTHTKFDK